MQVTLTPDEFEPIIARAVEAAIARFDETRGNLDRLAYPEADAAALISLEPHQLRDERKRGRIQASIIVNRGVRYLRADLVAYLMRHRTDAEGAR